MNKKKDRKERKSCKKDGEKICVSLSTMGLEPTTSPLLDIEVVAARAARKYEWIAFKDSYEQSDKKMGELKAKLRDLCPGKIRSGSIKVTYPHRVFSSFSMADCKVGEEKVTEFAVHVAT